MSGCSLDRWIWSSLVEVVGLANIFTTSGLERSGLNLVEGLQVIVTLGPSVEASSANPAAKMQITMMLAFPEGERQTVRDCSNTGQIRARQAGKTMRRSCDNRCVN